MSAVPRQDTTNALQCDLKSPEVLTTPYCTVVICGHVWYSIIKDLKTEQVWSVVTKNSHKRQKCVKVQEQKLHMTGGPQCSPPPKT